MANYQAAGWKTWLDRLAMASVCLFTLECVVGSSGRLITFGPLSLRMVLFILCFVLSLPNVLWHFKQVLGKPHVLLTLAFGLYLLILAGLGLKNGNRPQFVWADITTFLTLALLPGFLATVRTQKRVHILMDMVYYGAVITAAATVGLHIVNALLPKETVAQLAGYIEGHSLGFLSGRTTAAQRIFLKSQIFLQFGACIGLWKLWKTKGIGRWLLFLGEAVLIFTCLLSLTRAFWLGLAVSALVLLVLEMRWWKRYLLTLGGMIGILAVLFVGSGLLFGGSDALTEVVNRAKSAVEMVIKVLPGTEEATPEEQDPAHWENGQWFVKTSTQKRKETLEGLSKRIQDKPVFGNGLGTNLDEVREDGKTEYMYLDVLMKGGAVGLGLFMAVFFLPVYPLLRRRFRQKKQKTAVAWQYTRDSVLVAAYIGVAATSWFNPFLNNPMGITLMMLLASAVYAPVHKIRKKEA